MKNSFYLTQQKDNNYNKLRKKSVLFVKQIPLLLIAIIGFAFTTFGQTVVFSDDFETENGWIFTGEFERGTPDGNGGYYHGNENPTSAYSEINVIGTDLDGDYPNRLGKRAYSAISPAFDCLGYSKVVLNFQRWLNVEQPSCDHVYIDVWDGTSWNKVWENGATITEDAWSLQSLDISAFAGNQSNVKIRFALGSTDSGWTYSGWNIDDVKITGIATPIGFGKTPGLVFWHRGDLGVSGATPITNWGDQSGNGNHAVPDPTGPDQITSTSMNTQEVMDFYGTRGLNIPDDPRINTGGRYYNGDERTMFLAFKTGAGVTTTQYLFEEGDYSNGLGIFVKNGNVYITIFNANYGYNSQTVYNEVSTNTVYTLSFIWDAGALSARLNNIPFSNSISEGTITTLKDHNGDISIGFTDYWTRDETGAYQASGANYKGEIAELIYYDKALTSEEEISLNDDLGARYGINVSFDKETYYSYQTGVWNNSSTWTHDPGGSTQNAVDIPNAGDEVVILSNRTVSLSQDQDTTNLYINIKDGGILDLAEFKFTNTLTTLEGTGLLRLASINFPSVITNSFVGNGGGTTEYYNAFNFVLPTQDTYNNLKINVAGVVATQMADITLNGDLIVENGTYRINDNSSTTALNLTINGNVDVKSGGNIAVGQGSTNTSTSSTGIASTVAPPFINYYTNFHTVIVKGDFTNNGTVRFTNLTYPVFNAFPPTNSGVTSGAASVYFMGATNNTLQCNGTTDFYNLIVDKGIDQSFKLTIYSNDYRHFRLFGANNSGGDITGATVENPNLKKALWIRTGTVELQGLIVIPSLSEGGGSGTPNSDFYIPVNGALVLNGDAVIVLSTADTYEEVNLAYGVSGGTGSVHGVNVGEYASSFSIYGKVQIDKGYFSTRESGGFITWDKASGQLIINGGIVDAKQFRASGDLGLSSYNQTGGEFILRGRFQRTTKQYKSVSDLKAPINKSRSTVGLDGSKGSFNINSASNVFAMSGGKISIYDASGTNGKVFDVLASSSNINVTGGTLEIIPTDGSGTEPTNLIITSNAKLGNLVINQQSGTSKVRLSTYPLTVLGNITITSGAFNANNLDVSVGGDFYLANGTTYTPGNNWTIFNGSDNQTFTVNLASALNLNKFKIDKSAGKVLTIAGSQNTLNVSDSMMIIKGTFADGGKTINLGGTIASSSYLYNSGVHSGTGKIVMNDNVPQLITGDGTGIFQNFELNNNTGTAPVSLGANTTINGALTFSKDKLFDISTYGLTFGEDARVVGAGTNRFILSAGNAGDGGVSKIYSASENNFEFPIGAPTLTPVQAVKYTPASIGINGVATTYGSITVVPVGYEHPNTTTKGRSLTYFWRTKSEGFSLGVATVNHSYTYSQKDVVDNGTTITKDDYVAAMYDNSSYAWTKYTATDVNEATNTIGGAGTFATLDYIDGEFTAGDYTPTNPFGTPIVYYSVADGLWKNATTWANSSGGAGGAGVPNQNDIVVIDNNHTVELDNNGDTYPMDYDVRNCASLQIETGSVFDLKSNTASNFGVVMSHPNGNGILRVTTEKAASSENPQFFTFPSGDFSDFNKNEGTTEFYDIDGSAGALYILPSNINIYGNLILAAKGADNIVMPNNSYTTIYGDLTCSSIDNNIGAWIVMAWDTRVRPYRSYDYFPVIEKTVHVKGNLYVNAGTFMFLNNEVPQHLVVDGDITIDTEALMRVDPNYPLSTPQANTINIKGSLINNNVAKFKDDGFYCDVTFLGSNNSNITNTAGTPNTIFNKVTINKGSSQATTLTCDIEGALTTPSDDWLTLQNGTFKYEHDEDLNITTTSKFTIPSTAGLYVNSSRNTVYLANGYSNDNDLFLNGKLTIINGDVKIGNLGYNKNNDIEYSAGGHSEIDIQGGSLTVNGQIRRNSSTTSGILKYNQTGGSLTINGRNALTTNAKLEILNIGSEFNMSGGTINIVHGGGTTYGDLYLRPANSSVTDGKIIFSQGSANFVQDYILDATISLNDLQIKGTNNKDATVKLLTSPLVLNGDLTLSNGNSIFDANIDQNLNVTINGNLENNGIYKHYNNLTTFSGGVQSILGSSPTDFYNLLVNSVTSLTLNNDIDIYNNLELTSGILICVSNTVSLQGNFVNNAAYTETSVGIILEGTSQQLISGTGTFGRLELDNISGARIENAITLNKNFALTNGVFDINKYLFTLGENSSIEGSDFGSSKMIVSDGVFSAVGISKVFGSTGTFTYPLGVAGKYTPVVITIDEIGNTGSVRINNINSNHTAVLHANNVLHYYWEVESSGLTGFTGKLELNYLDEDVRVTETNKEADYIAAGLLTPGSSWMKVAHGSTTDNVDEVNNTITFGYSSSNSISGEYTAGIDAAIPDQVPEFTSINSGNWSDKDNWNQTGGDAYILTGAPNGFIIIIDSGDEISVNNNNASAYRITINGKLKIMSHTSGHNFGTVSGNGILNLESGTFPAGRYTAFLDCENNSTLEYGGDSDYTLIADLYDQVPNLVFSGTGNRILPNKNLTVCNSLEINGPILDNSAFNKELIIKGNMDLLSGSFNSGSGSGAIVCFEGSSSQTLKGFSGNSAFNNFEINNNAGLVLTGDIDIKGSLLLTNGLITTTSDSILTIANTSINCVIPAGGSSSSYVNGPLVKVINRSDDFLFPIGKDANLGNKLTLENTHAGKLDWTAEYFNPNPTATSMTDPLTYVNGDEYWSVSSVPGSEAIINLAWDAQSDLTLVMTENGLSDMRVAEYIDSKWEEHSSSAAGNSVSTNGNVNIAASGSSNYTTACINAVKPRAKLSPTGPICGNLGIPVSFTYSEDIPLYYTLDYTVNGIAKTQIKIESSDSYKLPTPIAGTYKLTVFTYNSGADNGVVDPTEVEVYDNPTTPEAGKDKSLCGETSFELEGNFPAIGIGLWSIESGEGGSFDEPTVNNTTFHGTNEKAYTLRWTITNGDCELHDEVNIIFPLLAAQPGDFTQSSDKVCSEETGVVYSVPNDETVDYIWDYDKEGVTISVIESGSENSVTLDFSSSAKSGTLSVTASNDCGYSEPREIYVTVNPLPVVSLISDDADNTICTGTEVHFTANSSSGPAISNYDFQIDGGSKQSGTTNIYNSTTLAHENKVSVIATTAAGCSSISNEITMSVADEIWTGKINNDWSNGENWACGSVPTSIQDIIIPTGAINMPVINGTGSEFRDIIIESATTLTISGDCDNEIYGNFKNDGSFVANSGDIIFKGNSTVSGNGNIIIDNVTIDNGETVTACSGNVNITGDFINNGSFVNNNGAITFNGSSQQTILGDFDGANTLNDITINNAAGVILKTGNKVIDGVLTLTNGKLYSGDLLTLGQNASTNVTVADGKVTSYIVGSLSKIIFGDNNGEFFFPIGTNTMYKPAGVSNVGGGLKPWKVIYNESPQENNIKTGEEIVRVSNLESWTIISSGTTANITLSWHQNFNGDLYVSNDLNSLRIAHLDNSSEWVSTGLLSSNTGTDTDFGTITSSNEISFDAKKSYTSGPEEFTLASTSAEENPLPIDLLSFNAKCIGNSVNIEWATVSEINNDYFTIEKSDDAINFIPIENVEGAGNSSEKLNYKIIDNNPYEGINYYRLTQTDFDGIEKYYSIIPVNYNLLQNLDEANIVVSPNPICNEDVSVIIDGFCPEENIFVGLYDITGNIVWENRMKPIASDIANLLNPIIRNLNKGLYFLVVSDKEKTEYVKIIKI
ncbi:MAG: T9SS type A sorting domain-containing protein [Bacteroidetes bacterium]|nr:T9SS type A sorting domain-containing protein [Bacteroidota bacterium]